MEFEQNTPTTVRDTALAAAPKVTLQPIHPGSELPPATFDRSNNSARTFDFEREATAQNGTAASVTNHPHHRTAVLSALLCVIAFSLSIGTLLVLR